MFIPYYPDLNTQADSFNFIDNFLSYPRAFNGKMECNQYYLTFTNIVCIPVAIFNIHQ